MCAFSSRKNCDYAVTVTVTVCNSLWSWSRSQFWFGFRNATKSGFSAMTECVITEPCAFHCMITEPCVLMAQTWLIMETSRGRNTCVNQSYCGCNHCCNDSHVHDMHEATLMLCMHEHTRIYEPTCLCNNNKVCI